MRTRLQTFWFRFAEQVLNSKLAIKQEIETVGYYWKPFTNDAQTLRHFSSVGTQTCV
jgi:hypothetical protein